MSSISSISASGMRAAQSGLRVAAHNVANLATPAVPRLQLQRSSVVEGGVRTQVLAGGPDSASAPLEDLLAARNELLAFNASASLLRRHDQMLGTLLDTWA